MDCLCHAQHVTSILSWLDHDIFLVQLDEFQDVAHAQYRLLYALTCNASSGSLCQRVTIVGDGDQAIYDWRGADVRLFEVWHHCQKHCQPYTDSCQDFVIYCIAAE